MSDEHGFWGAYLTLKKKAQNKYTGSIINTKNKEE